MLNVRVVFIALLFLATGCARGEQPGSTAGESSCDEIDRENAAAIARLRERFAGAPYVPFRSATRSSRASDPVEHKIGLPTGRLFRWALEHGVESMILPSIAGCSDVFSEEYEFRIACQKYTWPTLVRYDRRKSLQNVSTGNTSEGDIQLIEDNIVEMRIFSDFLDFKSFEIDDIKRHWVLSRFDYYDLPYYVGRYFSRSSGGGVSSVGSLYIFEAIGGDPLETIIYTSPPDDEGGEYCGEHRDFLSLIDAFTLDAGG